ncbi:uncharacterized protein LOC131696021 [Topomyia yanbarensis]|uniref:uncharacterized protein LOC131696021 n=1 Tax=Topomyia yanbarensis TaxID=2498891 RepID=UPI00273A9F6E|nr:uncharacterized protein LOC131696021 [Topomyia yanbarensis]
MRNRSTTNEDVGYSDRWIFDFAKKVCPDSVPAQEFSRDTSNDTELSFSMVDFSIALLSCNNNAPGPDNIKFALLKNLPDSAKKRLLNLFNCFLEQNIVPREWRQVKVVAIQKPGKPASDHHSYRPISMLSCIRKLLEKMILRHLDNWAEANQLLSETQFGFRRGKGTNDCLALLTTEVDIAFAKRQQMTSVFLDIKGAFDSVSIDVLSEKLHRSGLSPKLNNFLTNLLREKHMSFAHGSSSTLRFSYSGLPQGSCLSPLLYNIYVSSIDDCLTCNCTLRQLADDGVVSVVGTNGKDMQKPLQDTLDNLSVWANDLGIEFSVEKTEMVIFSKKRDPAKFQLLLDGKPITHSMFFKYLGIFFDSKGTWGKHIGYLKQKCQQRVNFLRSITGTWWGAHPLDLIRLYKTTILSVIEYGSFCFRSAAKTHILQLERIQYRCLRVALGCMHSTHTMSLEVIAGVLPLAERFYELSLRLLIRSEVMNPLVINNFEALHSLEVHTKRMFPYYDYLTLPSPSKINPAENIPLHFNNPQITFDLTMKHFTQGIPDHLRPSIIPAIFSANYNHIDQDKQFFTDGSSIDGSTGFGVFNVNHSVFRKLEEPCSVYVAELAAIHCALGLVEVLPSAKYFIFSDSLSSIEALQSMKPTKYPSHFLLEIRRSLRALVDQSFHVTFVWVPAHCSIQGNEKADELAKKGATEGNVLERPITHFDCNENWDFLVADTPSVTRFDVGAHEGVAPYHPTSDPSQGPPISVMDHRLLPHLPGRKADDSISGRAT